MNTLPLLMCILVVLFGISVGSFLNVCILRIPAGESIVTGPSHCPQCGRRLRWYELIPILSFLALGGRCAACKTAISPQYPLIEGANGLLWLLCFWVLGFSWQMLLGCFLLSALLTLSVIDARTREIPPGLNWFILVLAVAATALDFQNWLSHLIGFFAVSLPLFLIYTATKGKGIGGGDIKLMAVCGLFLGWQLILLGFFLGCICASVIHVTRMRLKKADRSLSFGPYLSAGVLLALLWGEGLIRWYLALLV